jgi:hypothetical protein
MGDFVAQQYYVDEHRHQRKNMGEKPKYYICDDHIPIVSRELWEKAQETLDRGKPRAEPTQSKPMPLNDENYPEGLARSIHFAYENDGESKPIHKNYGILFAEGRISGENTIVPVGVRNHQQ